MRYDSEAFVIHCNIQNLLLQLLSVLCFFPLTNYEGNQTGFVGDYTQNMQVALYTLDSDGLLQDLLVLDEQLISLPKLSLAFLFMRTIFKSLFIVKMLLHFR